MKNKEIKELNKDIGRRIKTRRLMLGISQIDAGEHLGVSYQQIQKYEKGQNLIPIDKLYHLCTLFNVSITYFFEDTPELLAEEELDDNSLFRLTRAYRDITDTRIKEFVIDMTLAAKKLSQ